VPTEPGALAVVFLGAAAFVWAWITAPRTPPLGGYLSYFGVRVSIPDWVFNGFGALPLLVYAIASRDQPGVARVTLSLAAFGLAATYAVAGVGLQQAWLWE